MLSVLLVPQRWPWKVSLHLCSGPVQFSLCNTSCFWASMLRSCTVPFLCPTPAGSWAVSTIYLLWNITCQQIFLLQHEKAEFNADSAATKLSALNSPTQWFVPLSLSGGRYTSRDLWTSIAKTICRANGLAVKCWYCPLMIIIQCGISSKAAKE